jgi:L-asparaginase
MQQYATGHQLHKAGVISGLDMTKEAIHCKLLYLFSKELEIAEIKRKMQTNLRGELSELR